MAAAVKSVADSVPFSDFCSILEKINVTKGNNKKKGILKWFIDHWREAHLSLHGADRVPNNVSSVYGLYEICFLLSILHARSFALHPQGPDGGVWRVVRCGHLRYAVSYSSADNRRTPSSQLCGCSSHSWTKIDQLMG